MIPIHRLTHPHEPVLLNCDQIQMIESTPDTVITLTNGAGKLVVMESPAEIEKLVRNGRSRVLREAFPAE
jgi:uncharacterized protein YlzI (FlbEa/FlbD family)